MDDLENKTSNELLFEIKQLEADHEAIKLKMLKDYDKMEELQIKYERAHKIIFKRINSGN